jgi:hypothetical protein
MPEIPGEDAQNWPQRGEGRVADRLSELRRRRFVGRQRELDQLERCTDADGPAVTFLHGIGGMGKSALLEVFQERLRARGLRSIYLDARNFEPTPRGFWQALGAKLGVADGHGDVMELQAAAALAGMLGVSVLVIDHVELARLLDEWWRSDFVLRLPGRVRLLLAGRHPPTAGWSQASTALVQSYSLNALDETDSRALLERRHAPPAVVPGILRFAQGHPLAMELALAAASGRPRFDFGVPDRSRVIARLARLFLQDLAEPSVRAALEAACVVRHASRSFLASQLGPEAATQAIDRLAELGFIEPTAEGLSVHSSVRQALEGELRASDPVRHRELRRAAWQHLRRTLPSVGRAHLWQHAADALFLLEQDLIREAFFPSARDPFVVERARDQDWPEIASISGAYDSPEGVAVIGAFFRHARHAVRVARSEHGEVLAFYVLARSDQVPEPVLACDRLLACWLEHHPRAEAPALLLRRLLAGPTRVTHAEAYAACVLDLKRSYVEHPQTTRLYAATSDISDHPEWGPLGFRELPRLSVPGLALGAGAHSTFCLDFGPGGIFGWISRLVDAQYESPELLEASSMKPRNAGRGRGLHLDEDLCRLAVDGAEVPLTPLQFNLLRHLASHSARVVDRDELVQAVWKRAFVGSNVVDAAVRSLRKKLGAHAGAIETVKGFGYRFHATYEPP